MKTMLVTVFLLMASISQAEILNGIAEVSGKYLRTSQTHVYVDAGKGEIKIPKRYVSSTDGLIPKVAEIQIRVPFNVLVEENRKKTK